MATLKQIEANRLNSLKSTGPKTEEGKAVSRGNSYKHGLSGEGIVIAPSDLIDLEERLEEWGDSLPTDDPVHAWHARRVVVESLRIDKCTELAAHFRSEFQAEARDGRRTDRLEVEAQKLLRKLHKEPALVIKQLESTLHGCKALVKAWNDMGYAMATDGSWTPEQRDRVLDLLGQPLLCRDCLTAAEIRKPEVELRAHRVELIRSNLIRLDEKVKVLTTADRRDRELATYGIGAEMSPKLKQIQKMESACHRRMRESFQALGMEAPPSPASAPTDADVTRMLGMDPEVDAKIERELTRLRSDAAAKTKPIEASAASAQSSQAVATHHVGEGNRRARRARAAILRKRN